MSMRSILIILVLLLVGLQYKLWLGDGSVLQWMQLGKQLTVQEHENEQRLLRNTRIDTNVVSLKSGNAALEQQAREELGMVKDDETYYQFVD